MSDNDLIFYTEKELTQRLRLSRQTLKRLRQRGELRPIKVGKAVRYPHRTVEAWLKTKEGSVA